MRQFPHAETIVPANAIRFVTVNLLDVVPLVRIIP